MVQIDDEKPRVALAHTVQAHEPLRLAVGVPTVRGSKEDRRGTVRCDSTVFEVLASDREVGAGVVHEGEVRREREPLGSALSGPGDAPAGVWSGRTTSGPSVGKANSQESGTEHERLHARSPPVAISRCSSENPPWQHGNDPSE